MTDRRKLGEVLLAEGLLTDVQLKAALGEQARWGHRLGETVVQMGFVEETDLVRVLSRRFGFPGVDLRDKTIEPHVAELVSPEIALKYGVLPLFVKREGSTELLFLGMEEPANLTAIDEVSFRTGLGVRPVVVGPVQMRRALAEQYEPDSAGDGEISGPITEAPLVSGDTAPMIGPVHDVGDDDLVAPPISPGQWTARDDREREIDPSTLEGEAEPEPTPEPPPLDVDPDDLASESGPVIEGEPIDPDPRDEDGDKPRDVPTRQILKALVRVLIEREMITRDELMAAVQAASKDPDAS